MLQRIVLISSLAVAGLAGFVLGEPGQLAVLGRLSFSYRLVLPVATLVIVILGVLDAEVGTWLQRLESALLPALLTLGFFRAAHFVPQSLPQWLPVAGLGVTLPVVLAIELAPDIGPALLDLAVTIRRLVVYLAAFMLFASIYEPHLRARISAPQIGVVAALLALVLLRRGTASSPAQEQSGGAGVDLQRGRDEGRDRIVGALVAGLVAAQAAWALLFWPVPAIVAGVTLLAVFYAAGGLMSTLHGEQVRWSLAAEYALVGLVTLAIIVTAVLRAG